MPCFDSTLDVPLLKPWSWVHTPPQSSFLQESSSLAPFHCHIRHHLTEIHELDVQVLLVRIHHVYFKVNNENAKIFGDDIWNTCRTWCQTWTTMVVAEGTSSAVGSGYEGMDQGGQTLGWSGRGPVGLGRRSGWYDGDGGLLECAYKVQKRDRLKKLKLQMGFWVGQGCQILTWRTSRLTKLPQFGFGWSNSDVRIGPDIFVLHVGCIKLSGPTGPNF